jgi:hypothetical protein
MDQIEMGVVGMTALTFGFAELTDGAMISMMMAIESRQ